MSQLTRLISRGVDVPSWLAAHDMVWTASDADQNDRVTGQTSFAATTPTFLLDVPDGTAAIPLLVTLGQTGTVAGGAIDVIVEKDNVARRASSGTAETVYSSLSNASSGNNAILYSGATASAGYGIRLMGLTLGQDVSPAEGVSNEIVWTPKPGLEIIKGPGSLLVYTYADTTGPTWYWTVSWAEVPEGWV